MLNQTKIIGLTVVYAALIMLVETINLVYPHVDQVALTKRTSCG